MVRVEMVFVRGAKRVWHKKSPLLQLDFWSLFIDEKVTKKN